LEESGYFLYPYKQVSGNLSETTKTLTPKTIMWKIDDEAIWKCITNPEYEMEFDYIGIDILGQVALFSTFNTGFIPDCVIRSRALYNDLATFLETLTVSSDALKIETKEGQYDEWEEYARKGIFAYDNENIHSTNNVDRYHLIYKLLKPINISGLSGLQNFKTIIPSFNLEFKDSLTFDELKNALK
jgi:hypothetical protein